MYMKQCPNCNKIYRDFDQYCLVCRYKLKYIEGTKKIEYAPDPTGNQFTRKETVVKSTPKCPTCGSINVEKIGTGERVASVAMFGLFSKKINKSFKCKSCGYTW